MFIIKYKSLFIGISALLVIASCVLFFTFGIKRGIDFTGGTTIEIKYEPSETFHLDKAGIEAIGVNVYEVDPTVFKFVTTEQYEIVDQKLASFIQESKTPYLVTQINTVGPTLGAEMTRKAIIAITIVVLAILAFIAFSFRGISVAVSSWKYGVVAMLTMVHDIIIPAGVYTLLSHYYGAEVDTLFVIALLTIMAVTISDKIVVFDRIRENLKVSKGSFDEIVGMSLRQTAVRSINTSLTTVLALVALYIWGPASTQFFALTLMVGMIVGTYSSICVASPLLTVWNKGK